MFNKKAYFIVLGVPDPDKADSLKAYAQAAPGIIKGKPVARYDLGDKLVGDKAGTFLTIVEHESEDAIKEAFASEAYQEVIPLRDEGFAELDVFLARLS